MSQRTRPATSRSLGDGRVGIWCHYDDRLEAKALPGSRWDPSLKCWTVSTMFLADADAVVNRLNARFAPASSAGGDHSAMTGAIAALFLVLPADLRQRVHRGLSRALHPDTGGTDATGKALNAAWDEVAR